MEGFPSALIIASYEAVCRNNNVLYRLVKPLPDGTGVQSTDRLVNVIPHRRLYTFDRKDDLDAFGYELLRRPLVLQPILHFGRGFGNFCGCCYQDEPWLVMVNQTHPKILGRIQMGMDAARSAIEKGQAFYIKFRFGKLIQRVYRAHLAQKELGEAKDSNNPCSEFMTYFRYAEWEHGDLVLRYLGSGDKRQDLHSVEMRWDFEDIGMHEMVWSHIEGQTFPKPHMAPVTEEEIRQILPTWTVNGVSPLECIGETIPQQNYSYAKAGRLYESFRKKKRHQSRQQEHAAQAPSTSYEDPDLEEVAYRDDYTEEAYHDNSDNEEVDGALGFDPHAAPRYVDLGGIGIEHDFSHSDREPPTRPARSRGRYQDPESPDSDSGFHHPERNNPISRQRSPEQPYHDIEDSVSGARLKKGTKSAPNPPTQAKNVAYPVSQNAQRQQMLMSPQAASNPDRYGHTYANVQIKSPTTLTVDSEVPPDGDRSHYGGPDYKHYNKRDSSASDYHHFTPTFKKQDSDRSSRSTNADSGYCPEGDGQRSRGDSYDYNEQGHMNGAYSDDGLENPAFRHDDQDTDYALKKHKELVSRMMQDQHGSQQPRKSMGSISEHSPDYKSSGLRSPYTLSPKDLAGDVMRAPPRQKRAQYTSSSSEPVAESFI